MVPSYLQTPLLIVNTYAVIQPIGVFFTGVTLHQYGYYMRQNGSEPMMNKVIATCAVLSSIGLSISGMWMVSQNYHKTLFHTPGADKPSLGLALCTVFITLCGLATQFYFSGVVGKMINRKNLWLFVSSTFIALIILGSIQTTRASVYASIHGLKHSPYIFVGKDLVWYSLWLGSSAVYDLTLSAILCLKFWGRKRESNFGSTTGVLTNLLVSTMETFALTTTCALLSLALNSSVYAVSGLPATSLEMGATTVNALLARFYVISLLYSLNRRARLRICLRKPQGFIEWPQLNDGTDQTSGPWNITVHVTKNVYDSDTIDKEVGVKTCETRRASTNFASKLRRISLFTQ